MSDELVGFIICRSALPPEPIDASYQRGYQCKTCSKPLQVSPEGVAQIARGGTPLCNACGFKLARLIVQKNQPSTIGFNPEAMEYLKSEGIDLEAEFRRDAPASSAVVQIDCPICGREYSARQGQAIHCPCGIQFTVAKA